MSSTTTSPRTGRDAAPVAGAGLVVHRAARGDLLVAGLAELLDEERPEDAFAVEVVSVPTRGVERWLTQSLAELLGPDGEGVCAGIQMPTLDSLLARVERQALGEPEGPSPWQPQRLVWSVLAALDAVVAEPWAASLAAHLGPVEDVEERHVGRRWACASRLARLFARYEAQRPELLARWAAGDDTDVPADLAWQPGLWRATAALVGGPDPVQRWQLLRRSLAERPERLELPPRLSVFGPTRLGRRQLQLLEAVAEHRQVHLWLPHVSPARWRRTAERLAADRPATGVQRRTPPAQGSTPGNRLLARLGRDQDELQLLLAGSLVREVDHGVPAAPDSLLGRLQAGVHADAAALPPDRRTVLTPDDRSVQIHSSHDPDRQVEVLREVLLGLLADDPTLEPRDIVVMCPDVETFAPLVHASFGLGEEAAAGSHPGHRLRVRLADRSLRQVNPLLELLTRVLALVTSRAPASELLDLALSPAVAARFGFRPEDQPRLVQLVTDSGMRWGIDHLHREQFGMRSFAQNTWAAGLQRLLLGTAMSEDGRPAIGTVLPLDGVSSSEITLVGGLAELVSRLRQAVTALGRRQGVTEWVAASRSVLEALALPPRDEQWQLGHALAQLADLDERVSPGTSPVLSPVEFAALLAEELQGRPTRGSFGTGALTLCTLSPMRSVPHRVVCLLGIDDGVFPRRGTLDGDDVLALDPAIGDHDPFSEDRQLLLDAVMAATETLVVVHAAADPRTGTSRPEAVPLRELLDAVDDTVVVADGTSPAERIRTWHPLQPFAPACFTAAPGRPPTSFDVLSLAAARAGRRRRDPEPFDPARLPPLPTPEVVELHKLIAFFEDPALAFAQARFGLHKPYHDGPAPAEMAIALNGLDRWAVGNRVLGGALQGEGWEELRRAEQLRGELPPGSLAEPLLAQIQGDVSAILAAADVRRGEVPEVVPVRLELADVRLVGAEPVGLVLTGSVGGVRGDTVTTVTYSKLAPKRQLRAWLELLVLCAAHPGRGWEAHAVGKVSSFDPPLRLGPVPQAQALTLLHRLVGIYLRGRTRPAPLPCGAAAAYARARHRGADDRAALQQRRVGVEYSRDREASGWKDLMPTTLAELVVEPAGPEERLGGDVSHRFGQLALALWSPLLQHQGRR